MLMPRGCRSTKKTSPAEYALQLWLAIATAEDPRGATRGRSRDRLGGIRAGAPRAIRNGESAAPATMDEVALDSPCQRSKTSLAPPIPTRHTPPSTPGLRAVGTFGVTRIRLDRETG